MRKLESKLLTRGLTTAGGSLLVLLAGLVALRYFGPPLARLSYDLPFLWRNAPTLPEDIVLVYLDDVSARKLNQPLGDVWNRTLHAQLLDRLSGEGARLVFFDVVFDAAGPDPAADEALA